jgi:hypothetical protein
VNEKRKGSSRRTGKKGWLAAFAISSLIEEMATNDAAASVLDIDALRALGRGVARRRLESPRHA